MKRVLTYGTFDLLHYGHIRLLKRAKALGDYLIVALSTDEFNALKGKKSYHPYNGRKEMLEAIRYVDLVIPGNDDAVRSVSLIAGKIADAVVEAKEGNLTTIDDEDIETMQELVDKEGVDKIERKPKQNNRRNYTKRENRKEETTEVKEEVAEQEKTEQE